MKAVILAAGRGARLKPLTDTVPKPMLRISGKPILEYTFKALPNVIDEVIIVVHYLADIIKDHFGDFYDGKIITYIRQDELNGTAGALFSCQDYLDDKFLVLMADDLYDRKDIEKLLSFDNAILAKVINDPTRFGVFEVDENNNLLGITEKPKDKKSSLVNIGAYILDKKIFDYDPVAISNQEFGLPQTIVEMAKEKPVKIIKTDFWHPIGVPEDLKTAERKLSFGDITN